jgi:hypothetical protein
MAAGVEHHSAGAHGFRHAPVVIEGVHKAANFQNRFPHRLALFLGQQGGKFFFLLKNCVASREQNCAAFGRCHGRPFLKRALSGIDGAANIRDRSLGYVVDNFSGGWVADFGSLSALGIRRFTGD